jgi:hypothetical protein
VRLCEAGLSKESLLTGNYNQAAYMKVGVQKWRSIEQAMQAFHKQQPDLLKIIAFIAQNKLKIT